MFSFRFSAEASAIKHIYVVIAFSVSRFCVCVSGRTSRFLFGLVVTIGPARARFRHAIPVCLARPLSWLLGFVCPAF